MCHTRRMSVMKGAFRIFALTLCFLSQGALAAESTYSNSLGMEFVLIRPGKFVMGSPPGEAHRSSKEVQHEVGITRSFYMHNTEVTLKQWREIMGKRMFGRRDGTDQTPAHRISWFDAMDFIKKLNERAEGKYRLPTEAEWEYACRAGTVSAYSWGEAIDCTRAMYDNSDKSPGCRSYIKSKGLPIGAPAPVKSYPPNPWGLYDMHGNAWEWCSDWYADYPRGLATDPVGADSGPGKVRRGGSWFKHGEFCRSANRNYGHAPTRYRTTGFRLVREVE